MAHSKSNPQSLAQGEIRSTQGLPVVNPHAAGADIGAEQHLRRITGINLTAVDGLSLDLTQKIISEIGTDMSKFPSEKHFTSWLKLCPNNQITGGKIISSTTGKCHNRARQAFLQAAASVARSNSALGAFYRRLKARIGPAQARSLPPTRSPASSIIC